MSIAARRRARRVHMANPAQVVAGRTTTSTGFAVCPWCLSPISTIQLVLWLTEAWLPLLHVTVDGESRSASPPFVQPTSIVARRSIGEYRSLS